MSFLYCLQDIIYEYGDDTYPTTGKQDKAWLNKPIQPYMFQTALEAIIGIMFGTWIAGVLSA